LSYAYQSGLHLESSMPSLTTAR